MSNTFSIQTLGPGTIKSPYSKIHQNMCRKLEIPLDYFVSEDEKILYNISVNAANRAELLAQDNLIEKAGPRKMIYFEPETVRAGIVTCGGLCPGLNNVIRSVVMCLWHIYGVKNILGIRNGLKGFLPEYNRTPIKLNPDLVKNIHMEGGTFLGSSRGGRDRIADIAESILSLNLTMLFIIGGDGTQRAAATLCEKLKTSGRKISIIGIPKTIDNDLSFIDKSFGFQTAVDKATEAIAGAHVEATNTINGVGIVKLMGRESGFIACHAALALNDVNYVLIPEVPFDLYGESGLFSHLQNRLKDRNHAVIVVAEGAGLEYIRATDEVDESGNKILPDIGTFICQEIKKHFKAINHEINLKYIDPSYIIRSTPANPSDSLYCYRLGHYAVHAGMSGKTNMLISNINNHFVHIPLALAISTRNQVNINSELWKDVLEATGQPCLAKKNNCLITSEGSSSLRSED